MGNWRKIEIRDEKEREKYEEKRKPNNEQERLKMGKMGRNAARKKKRKDKRGENK